MSSSNVLGVVLIARHGDRQGFYQDPITYDASNTAITPLGELQEQQLGQYVGSVYLNSSSPSYFGLSTVFDSDTFSAQADFADEGFVIIDSANALLQGLFPPNATANTIALANGSSVTGPFQGYQYVPVDSIGINDVSLEGFTDCNTQNTRTSAFYNSTAFQQKANESAAFLSQLPPFLDGRPVTLVNMWNIYDFMNVQSIHNATFAKNLPPTFLAQARDLANWHEWNVFSDSTLGGIGNIAGTAMLPSVLSAMQDIANSSNPLKFSYTAISYKPFLSLFNMTGVNADGQVPPAIVNYAAALALEVRQPSGGGEPFIRFQFKNGTDDDVFKTYNMQLPSMSSPGDVPLSTFLSTFEPVAINTTLEWCLTCNQTTLRGCGALLNASSAAASAPAPTHHDRISPVGAGFLGAGLTFAVYSMLLAALVLLGLLNFGKRGSRTASRHGLNSEDNSINHDKRPSS
ncbi:uncharacterized protein PHACADRAFT_265304 [Phanerochaete carnosa HHB-10118-sp]|uniref:Phosphoglycerate mutase-like protein n=1 Tax=Phanerochaete carnosa (strain HHB-10118-sp) TaxID=650164 RepID=K5WHK4_PHACS|nr:uncharacterized protein PHACADRAFT_265304 [Phanerochaete carnosa HHB-10118-sp]EKM49712.1 hypothetical protein PHACADRAFT_265304 [Phanerochaete carnosa HHB-10118-sp]